MIALSFGRARVWTLTLAWCCAATAEGCGGAQPEAKPASEAASEAPAPKKVARHDPEPEAEPEEAPARSSCDDGGCFACGNGSCPSGWYCDENASGGAACSWLPACGSKGSCACVGKTLGCTCSDTAGGAHVSCK